MSDIFTLDAAKVTVSPAAFTLVNYDAGEIATLVKALTEELGIANPVHVAVDETTPMGRASAEVGTPDEQPSSDSLITIRAQSGALEDTRHFTNFDETRARLSLGRALLRARDRLRPDFADTPADRDLSLSESAAWDVYCAGRLARLGLHPNQQRFRYNFRNRFGFSDETDALFDRVWSADDLGWSDLPNG